MLLATLCIYANTIIPYPNHKMWIYSVIVLSTVLSFSVHLDCVSLHKHMADDSTCMLCHTIMSHSHHIYSVNLSKFNIWSILSSWKPILIFFIILPHTIVQFMFYSNNTSSRYSKAHIHLMAFSIDGIWYFKKWS